MQFKFYKYQGTGNDFVILDNRTEIYSGITPQQVKQLCDRRFGIGGDGLMLLNLADGHDFEMTYYNADGNESSMCGNGGRCLVQFAFDRGMKKKQYSFIAIDGPHEASFQENGWVRLKMKDVDVINNEGNVSILDTGSPHYVKIVEDVKLLDVFSEGKKIRYNDVYKEKGINVNFVEKQKDKLAVRTYERGVEEETFSCGTGVTACAIAVSPAINGHHRIDISTPGGDLAVEFKKQDHLFTNIWLCGPATFVFVGHVDFL